MNLPTGIRGRLTALALLAIPLILLVQYLLLPLLDSYRALDDEITGARADIAHYRRLLAQLPDLQEAVDRLADDNPLAPQLLAGGNQALAMANLQQRLQAAAERAGARVVSLRIRESMVDGPLERITVQAQLTADTRSLRDLLHDIETGSPYLLIDAFSIGQRSVRRRSAPAAHLEARLTVSGLRIPDPSDQRGAGRG